MAKKNRDKRSSKGTPVTPRPVAAPAAASPPPTQDKISNIKALFQGGREQEAKTAVMEFLAEHPREVKCLEELSRLCMERRNFDEASLIHHALVAMSPNNPHFRNSLAISLIMAGFPEQGGHHLEAAVELAPGAPMYLANLAKLRMMQQRWSEARELLERAQALNKGGSTQKFSELMEMSAGG